MKEYKSFQACYSVDLEKVGHKFAYQTQRHLRSNEQIHYWIRAVNTPFLIGAISLTQSMVVPLKRPFTILVDGS